MESKRLTGFLRHMPVVETYGQRLAALQNVWDSLSLLSQMSGDGSDMDHTRTAFESLSRELVNQLAAETTRTVVLDLRAKAQIAIDVMVRNLYERTADIGFLCTDDHIVQFMQQAGNSATVDARPAGAVRKRLREYVAKYSVYQNVILLGTDGTVLAQLDEQNALQRSRDALVARTIGTSQCYVETYGVTDLAAGRPALIYSFRVQTPEKILGVLCLCFRFEDETRAIFDKLRSDDDWTVLALLDPTGRVLASSDPWQLPLGAPLGLALQDEGRIVRFAGREYFAVTRPTQGYQGYMGPGWLAHAMVPLDHAFEQRSSQLLTSMDAGLLEEVHRCAAIFSPELRAIPERAENIQRELNRSVWNGNVRLSTHQGKENSFSKALLREISTTGRRTQEVFAQSIGDLHRTVLAATLHDSRLRASLAVEIMDRNLYERANDCRWWALHGTLRNCLAGACDAAAAAGVLEHVNALYTVYDNIILFDRNCQIVATSNRQQDELCGRVLNQSWARETLSLRDTQSFAVSAFEPFTAYAGRHTYVFTAAIRGDDGGALGGIAIVFDSEAQFAAMLRDVVPLAGGAAADGCCAVLVDADGKVIAATDRYRPGEHTELPASLLKPAACGAIEIVSIDGVYYAAGARRCGGYREFHGVGATAIVMLTLGAAQTESHAHAGALRFARRTSSGRDTLDVAVVSCGEHWLALPKQHIVEAIEVSGITRVPGRAPWLTGVTRHAGRMLPVIDLGYWLDTRSQALAVVVLRDGEDLVGLAVDQLGDVLEIGRDEIAPVDALCTDTHRHLTPQVIRPRDSDDVTLLLLDIGTLTAMLHAPTQRSA